MKIFPAIDIKNQKCVRLLKGDFSNQTIYDQSPFEQASKYKEFGLTNLHIVDLDGALSGELVNFETVNKIIKELKIRVEIGGGIRSLKNIETYVNLGVDKVILGNFTASFGQGVILKTPITLALEEVDMDLQREMMGLIQT